MNQKGTLEYDTSAIDFSIVRSVIEETSTVVDAVNDLNGLFTKEFVIKLRKFDPQSALPYADSVGAAGAVVKYGRSAATALNRVAQVR